MGGGAMRTAAKAALGGCRSGGPLAGQAAVAAAWRSSRPRPATVSAVLPVAEGAPAVPLLSSEKGRSDALAVQEIQRPSWEIDEWEFAGGEEEELLDSPHPAPRLVFGPVPTLEEAKEATADLKDAVERFSFDVNRMSQPDVVASLASDKNVWDAVMKNEKVMEFYRTQQSVVLQPETNVDFEESVGENECTKEFLESPKSPARDSQSSVFMEIMGHIKLKVTEMVSQISNFLQDLLGTSTGAQSSTSTKSTGSNGSNVDVAVGASFIALAIAAILVVLVKRG
ncbi:Bifunctional protein HldE [Cocos nucifera]|nr:Bifunctional protein HldE [Cocos nucifera]